jgi:hypothetical protein
MALKLTLDQLKGSILTSRKEILLERRELGLKYIIDLGGRTMERTC